MSVGGRTYQLQQFHFHTPSEHSLNGRQYAMEVHFVHGDANGRYAVVGAFIKAGAKNPAFNAVMAAAPQTDGQQALKRPIDPRQLVPNKSPFYRYAGSLTTPPCGEVVDWNVYESPIDVAETDIMVFKKIFPMNARPLQPLNRRFLLIGG